MIKNNLSLLSTNAYEQKHSKVVKCSTKIIKIKNPLRISKFFRFKGYEYLGTEMKNCILSIL